VYLPPDNGFQCDALHWREHDKLAPAVRILCEKFLRSASP
jgi:hypothetical protein